MGNRKYIGIQNISIRIDFLKRKVSYWKLNNQFGALNFQLLYLVNEALFKCIWCLEISNTLAQCLRLGNLSALPQCSVSGQCQTGRLACQQIILLSFNDHNLLYLKILILINYL